MDGLSLKYFNVKNVINEKILEEYSKPAEAARKKLLSKTGLGKEFTGWVDYPLQVPEREITQILDTVEEIKSQCECLVVIGIGGSYLGAKAAIDFLSTYYGGSPNEVVFLGNTVSPLYLEETLKYLETKDFCVNVISKSGKTLEPAIAFRFVRSLLIKKYGENYNKRVYVTTSQTNSILHDEALEKGYKEFYIPSNIGGRYSVFTAVGLLPIAYAGYDIVEFLKGAINSCQDFTILPFNENPCLQYAALRNILYNKGKTIECLCLYEPKFKSIGEWWKQLFGESEGKDGKGIFPVLLNYSTDLHSIGQYIQDGIRDIFETVLHFDDELNNISIEKDSENMDGLNYLAGKSVYHIRHQIMRGVIDAHLDGKVPNILIKVKDSSIYTLGYLLYFFMFACGVSGYLLDVNPFNQEGVEAYKKNMFALLKK